MKPRLCTRLACTSNRSTRRRRPASTSTSASHAHLQYVPYLSNGIPRRRKQEKNIENIRTNCYSLQLYTSEGTRGQCRICSIHVLPVYVQLMYLSASVCRYLAAGICRRYCRCMYSSVYRYGYRFSYRYRTLRYARYDINTGTRNFGTFGTTSIPAQETSIGSVRYQYEKFDKFGTTTIPVPETSVSSVRYQYRYQKLW